LAGRRQFSPAEAGPADGCAVVGGAAGLTLAACSWSDGGGTVDRWPDAAARVRAIEVFQRLDRLEAAAVGAEELTPEEVPFLRFDPAAQELFDDWRADPPTCGRPTGTPS
jgi:hypothetical protein